MHRLLPLAALFACAPFPPGFGEHPADQAMLTEARNTAHLARSLPDGGAGMSVSDYLQRGPEFITAPDPTALFSEVNREARNLAPLEGDVLQLEVLTYNVALLDRFYLGNHVLSPDIGDRFSQLASTVFSGEYDVVLLQEVWEDHDAEILGRVAHEAGYTTWAGDLHHSQHGLMMAVRTALIEPGSEQTVREDQFFAQRKLERWPGPDVRRGWLTWGFTLIGTDRQVWFVDLHATSYPRYFQQRNLQAREVGLALRALADGDVVVVGGDFNSGPYYNSDVWYDNDGIGWADWWQNASAYALWLHYLDATDAMAHVEIPQDVVWGDKIPQTPYADKPFCDERAQMPFTGTDCNSLYDAQYGGTEFPARLDHLMVRDPEGRARVEDVRVVYTERLPLTADQPIELSDHYGVAMTLQVQVADPE